MKTEINIDLSSREVEILDQIEWRVREAMAQYGLIVTVERRAVMPPAMGRAETVLSVRREIDHVGEAAVRGGYQLEGSTCD